MTMASTGRREHRIEHQDWYATQLGRSVVVKDRALVVLRPPAAWGEEWGWNFTEGGIVLERTAGREFVAKEDAWDRTCRRQPLTVNARPCQPGTAGPTGGRCGVA